MIAIFDRPQNYNRGYIPELAICGALVLLSLWGMIWYETTGLLKHDIDGLLLMAICLLTGITFSVQFVLIARNAEWIKFLGRNRAKDIALSGNLQQARPMRAREQLAGRLR
jgi:hypothetical protein